jgi:hypothetical protein
LRRLALYIVALALAALLPLHASAQDAAPPMPEDPRLPRYRDVERGFFTGFELGYLTFFKTPVADRTKYQFAPANGGGRSSGFLVGGTVGYDLTPRLAVAAYAFGGNSSAAVNYGAFSVVSGGADVRVALVGVRDTNAVERLYVYLHGRGGFLLTYPQGLFGSTDGYFAGGPGIEYFTHLRHFSVGLAADVAYVPKAKTAGLAVSPTVRYTF